MVIHIVIVICYCYIKFPVIFQSSIWVVFAQLHMGFGNKPSTSLGNKPSTSLGNKPSASL